MYVQTLFIQLYWLKKTVLNVQSNVKNICILAVKKAKVP